MLYSLGLTGGCSRVAWVRWSEGSQRASRGLQCKLQKGCYDSQNATRTMMQTDLQVMLSSPDRPNVPVCRFDRCRVAQIFVYFSAHFGSCPQAVAEGRAAGRGVYCLLSFRVADCFRLGPEAVTVGSNQHKYPPVFLKSVRRNTHSF